MYTWNLSNHLFCSSPFDFRWFSQACLPNHWQQGYKHIPHTITSSTRCVRMSEEINFSNVFVFVLLLLTGLLFLQFFYLSLLFFLSSASLIAIPFVIVYFSTSVSCLRVLSQKAHILFHFFEAVEKFLYEMFFDVLEEQFLIIYVFPICLFSVFVSCLYHSSLQPPPFQSTLSTPRSHWHSLWYWPSLNEADLLDLSFV